MNFPETNCPDTPSLPDMKLEWRLSVCILAGCSLWAQDVPFEDLQQLFEYDRTMPGSVTLRHSGPTSDIIVAGYSFVGPDGGRVPGLLVTAQPTGARPLILFGHWMMKGSPLRGKEEFLEEAKLLAKAGATCVLLDSPLVREGVVTDPDPDGEGPKAQLQMAKEWRRALDLMLAGDDIDPDRIAYVGHSFGAGVGAMLTGVEKRIGSFVLMANQYSFREYAYDDQNPIAVAQRKEVGDQWIEDFLAKYPWYDTVNFVKHSSPASVFLQFGSNDEPIPPHIARLGFSHFGEPKRMESYDTGHALNAQARIDRVAWLIDRLGLQPVSEEALRSIPQLE
jgi:hypothetical protein